jgi:hypothetical protein
MKFLIALALATIASAATKTTFPTATNVPRPHLQCQLTKSVSYCLPKAHSYQKCAPMLQVVNCPGGSFCFEFFDTAGYTNAYCKVIG